MDAKLFPKPEFTPAQKRMAARSRGFRKANIISAIALAAAMGVTIND